MHLNSVWAGLCQVGVALSALFRLLLPMRTPLTSLLLRNGVIGVVMVFGKNWLSVLSFMADSIFSSFLVLSAVILLYNVLCSPHLRSERGDEISNIAYAYVQHCLSRKFTSHIRIGRWFIALLSVLVCYPVCCRLRFISDEVADFQAAPGYNEACGQASASRQRVFYGGSSHSPPRAGWPRRCWRFLLPNVRQWESSGWTVLVFSCSLQQGPW